MPTKRSKVTPSYKTTYKVTNWPAYDRALVRRGDITLWLTPVAVAAWDAVQTGRPGRPRLFSDVAIEAAIAVRMVFGQPWRQTEGLLNSVLGLLGVDLRSPDHTTLSRRSAGLEVEIPPRPAGEPLHILVDASGLKVFGRGEWATAKHGKGSLGTGWRKLHIAVGVDGQILAAELTEAEVADAEIAPGLFSAAGGDVQRITADSGYDRKNIYEAAASLGADVVIPPRKDAVKSGDPVLERRNEHIEHRKRVGKPQWRRDTGQHQQARVENSFNRYKVAFGRSLRARREDGQRVEVIVGCRVLNTMWEIGRPTSVARTA